MDVGFVNCNSNTVVWSTGNFGELLNIELDSEAKQSKPCGLPYLANSFLRARHGDESARQPARRTRCIS